MLDVPDQIIIERLTSRRLCKNCGTVYNIRFLKPKVEGNCDKCGGELYQRADDNEEVIKNRLQVYKDQTEPVVAYYKKKKIPFIVNVTTSIDQPPEPMVEHMMLRLKETKIRLINISRINSKITRSGSRITTIKWYVTALTPTFCGCFLGQTFLPKSSLQT